MKPSTEPSSGNGSPSAAGEDALTLARALAAEVVALVIRDGPAATGAVATLLTPSLDSAYARGRAGERAAGVAEGMAKAAEIARAMPTCVLNGNMTFTTTPWMVAEAILAASPPDLKDK